MTNMMYMMYTRNQIWLNMIYDKYDVYDVYDV